MVVLGNSPGRCGGRVRRRNSREGRVWTCVGGQGLCGLGETILGLLWPVRAGHVRQDILSWSLQIGRWPDRLTTLKRSKN